MHRLYLICFFKIALVSSLSEMIYLACKSGCLALYVVFSILFITAAVYFAPKYLLFNEMIGFKGSEILKFTTNSNISPVFYIYFVDRV